MMCNPQVLFLLLATFVTLKSSCVSSKPNNRNGESEDVPSLESGPVRDGSVAPTLYRGISHRYAENQPVFQQEGPTAAELLNRTTRSTPQGLQDLTHPVMTQQILLQQRHQTMATAMLQQQLMASIQAKRYYNALVQRLRPYRSRDYDDGDSDSDEDDELDSDEAISYPVGMGFIPPIPGFLRRK